MTTAALLTALSMMVPVSACPEPTRTLFDIVVMHGPIETSTDFTLQQLSAMAESAGRAPKHAPLGFYSGDFGYNVNVNPFTAETPCSEPVHVRVNVMLLHRQIQVAKELAAQPCLFSVAVDHYKRHAAEDDIVLSQFAKALEKALDRAPLPPVRRDAKFAGEGQERTGVVVSSVINSALASLDVARANARDTVDTPEEIHNLTGTCAPGT